MTLNEFRKVKFTQKLINLQDEDDDINIVSKIYMCVVCINRNKKIFLLIKTKIIFLKF